MEEDVTWYQLKDGMSGGMGTFDRFSVSSCIQKQLAGKQ